MKVEVANVPGFLDYTHEKALRREVVVEKIRNNCKKYGFLPIETPLVEFDEILKSSELVEDELSQSRFRLGDKTGRNLGLRYDLISQIPRVIKDNPEIKLPFRKYQIAQVLRDENILNSKLKQFTSCEASIIGDQTIEAELDCLLLLTDIMKDLHVKVEIQVNNRKLLNAIIDSVQMQSKPVIIKELSK